ncbi:chemotaxis protein CheB [Fulvivirga ligni]|uniref:chemotaxis protein CheB n=1 Tax=Fulvivirga ligni TaxID=2904246 RepID=UPI001F32F66C|nr:chemotaxis protein CheB [Fulvivirga ligni]UII20907.1 chemotaxis protein CheB [Fulvivirga ligni]
MENFTYVIGIGASAGGLEALKSYFSNLDASSGEAYVIIQHSLRSHKSLLPQILAQVTPVESVVVTENMELVGNKIYICPPSHSVRLKGNKFKLVEREDDDLINKTIDISFTALAGHLQEKMIGIVMSGTGSDGTEGCKCIEKNNGVVLVQDPSTAIFESMPLKSIIYDHPDYVLPPEEMPELVESIVTGNEDRNERRAITLDLST